MRRSQGGFTLIEVLVALVILALGMVAVYNVLGQAARNAYLARQQVYADWIAMDRIAEIRLANDWPSIGRSNGEVEFASETWAWEIETKETPVEGLRRLDVSIRLAADDDGDEPIVERSGFIRQTGNFPAGASVPWAGSTQPSNDRGPGAQPQPGPNPRPGRGRQQPRPRNDGN